MRVLVVDDERRTAAAIGRGLTAAGFGVELSYDGEDGLRRAREDGFDAIVLAVLLPEIDGHEVCRRLRSAGVWTPILMLSAGDGAYDQAGVLDLGADDHLTKPISHAVLVARLRALMRRAAPPRPAALSAGDLRLDPSRREVSRGGRRIDLTPREFALLEFLLRRRGDVVSKTEILRDVWDAYAGDVNVVEVYIGYLRRKIDVPFGRTAVRTVRGRGYRLAGDGG